MFRDKGGHVIYKGRGVGLVGRHAVDCKGGTGGGHCKA